MRKYLSSGSTLLNIACSRRIKGAFVPGKMINIIGDSNAGKSLLGLTILAEAHYSKDFNNYELYLDDVENANEFNLSSMFGKSFSKALKHAGGIDDNGISISSQTMKDFEYNIKNLFSKGKPFIYILDSFDALVPQEDIEKTKILLKKGDVKSNSYDLSKQKEMSKILREITFGLKETQSILIVISQTRQNIGITFGNKLRRSGGDALRFYSDFEMWLAVKNKIQKDIKGKKRTIGTNVRVRITRSRLYGRMSEIEFPVFYDYGIDDIRSCIDYLLDEGVWKKSKGQVLAKEIYNKPLGYTEQNTELIDYIEKKKLVNILKTTVIKTWREIENSMRQKRKKYE